LQSWLENGWIRRREPSLKEITSLLAIARRDLAASRVVALDSDNRFVLAYNAARTLCNLALSAEGYTAAKLPNEHQRQVESIEFTLGPTKKELASYLTLIRGKRHNLEYERAGLVVERDVTELIAKVDALHTDVVNWLRAAHPKLVPPGA